MNPYAEKLIAPDGREFTARSPAEYNDLRYGQGYRVPQPESAQPETKTESPRRTEPAATPRSSSAAAPKSKATPTETRDA